jgi:DNA-binding beta-propeller fold protein YncE
MGRGLVAALALAAVLSAGAAAGRIPQAKSFRTCVAAGPYWPTMSLAITGTSAWVGCKEQRRLVRVDLRSGRTVGTIPLDGAAIAVASGGGALWALDDLQTLYRIDPARARIVTRIALGTAAAYNIWTGAGSVWVADDQGAQVVRVSPTRNTVTARIPVGDGPADIAFAGGRALVVDHRDRTLFAIDLEGNRSKKLATLGGDAPERLAVLGGSLWVTGRGTQLFQVDPATGRTRRTIDIRGTGIDIVAAAGALWIPVRTATVDTTGFPTMTALRRVTTGGRVTTRATASGRVDVHGLAAAPAAVWLADTTGGALYRVVTAP